MTRPEMVVLVETEHARLTANLARTFGRDVAEDALGDALVALARHYPRLDAETAGGWVYVTARHAALAIIAQRGRTAALVDVAGRDDDADVWAAMIDARDRLARLGAHQRTALTGIGLGLRYTELAAATGKTYTWVNRHVREGRAALAAA